MNKELKIGLIAIGVCFFLIFGLVIIATSGDSNPYQDQNNAIIKKALIKETSNGFEGVCNEYELTNSKITLWCVDDLYPNGAYIIASRIANDVSGLQGNVKYDISFRGWTTRKTINVLYDYNFQEEFKDSMGTYKQNNLGACRIARYELLEAAKTKYPDATVPECSELQTNYQGDRTYFVHGEITTNQGILRFSIEMYDGSSMIMRDVEFYG